MRKTVLLGCVILLIGLSGCGGGSDPETTSKPVSSTADQTTGMVLVKVAGGTYSMGDTFGDGATDEKPTRQVSVGDFYIGKYEVTQGEWQKVMGSNPAYFKACGANCPVEQVSWNDIQAFISKLNQLSGKSYRLPTEAEWEYAARSGGQSQKYSGGNVDSNFAWNSGNAGYSVHQVGQKLPNSLELYDMSGNVWEWVNDVYGGYDSAALTNPAGPTAGTERVSRGGSWLVGSSFDRASYRARNTPDTRYYDLGFRLAATNL